MRLPLADTILVGKFPCLLNLGWATSFFCLPLPSGIRGKTDLQATPVESQVAQREVAVVSLLRNVPAVLETLRY